MDRPSTPEEDDGLRGELKRTVTYAHRRTCHCSVASWAQWCPSSCSLVISLVPNVDLRGNNVSLLSLNREGKSNPGEGQKDTSGSYLCNKADSANSIRVLL